jgi:UrcA family protein
MIIKTDVKTVSIIAFGFMAALSMTAAADSLNETTVTTSANGLRTATVSYADLDLTTADAQETLYYRLSGASRKVCGSSDLRRTGSLKVAAENKACYESTLEQAMSETNDSQMASIGN